MCYSEFYIVNATIWNPEWHIYYVFSLKPDEYSLGKSVISINQEKFIYIFSEFLSKYNKQKGSSKYKYKT